MSHQGDVPGVLAPRPRAKGCWRDRVGGEKGWEGMGTGDARGQACSLGGKPLSLPFAPLEERAPTACMVGASLASPTLEHSKGCSSHGQVAPSASTCSPQCSRHLPDRHSPLSLLTKAGQAKGCSLGLGVGDGRCREVDVGRGEKVGRKGGEEEEGKEREGRLWMSSWGCRNSWCRDLTWLRGLKGQPHSSTASM